MNKIEITIQGKTPLLIHRFTDEAAESATSGSRMSVVGDRGTPLEQAQDCLYVTDDGNGEAKPIMPQPNLFRCIIDAGKFHKAGRSKVTTQKSSLIPAAVTLNEMYYDLKHKEPWVVDSRPVRIPATGGRIIRHRPCFNDWEIDFEVDLETSVISEKMFRQIVDDAGNRIGLGDFRPDCKGPFGKFVVTKWEVKDDDD